MVLIKTIYVKTKKHFYKNNLNRGAAMIIVVIFFLFISLAILIGIITPTLREFKIAGTNFNSKNAYYLAESGVEDALYRIRNSKQIGISETLTLGDSSTTTEITTVSGNQKMIVSLGDKNSNQREISSTVTTATGVSFNYGVLVGQGGLDLNGSGTVNGNVYANGPITGDSSAVITGTAISANSPSVSTDQSNDIMVPSHNVTFANNVSAVEDISQSFQVSTESPLNKLQFYLRKVGTPNSLTVKIVNDVSGSPGTNVLASGTLNASSVTTSYGWVEVSLSTNPILDVGTTYWIVLDTSGNSSTKYYVLGANSQGYSSGVGKIGKFSGTWNNTTPSGLDYFFKLYLGGVNGLIAGSSGSQWSQLHIGTVSGTAQANTVNYTNVTGTLYCQSGTGNNKSCTSQSDPVYETFPISEANISQWESDATNGGTYTGNYTVGWAGATLGPKKIVGNLTVNGGGVLNVTGNLWVTGNVSLTGGGSIQLDSSYGTNDGVIVADGEVSISGGADATGSGATGSYLMVLTKSSSTTAASINGGAGAVIIYAPNGTIAISGGASLKEATGYKISISGGSSITYESGLSNNNFSSGPSGTWNVASWRETE